MYFLNLQKTFLNQARPSLQSARTWFLRIVSVQTSVCVFVFVCVCPPPRLLIIIGVMWRDMDPMRLLKQVLQLYMATVVIIVNGCGLGSGTRRTH